MPVDKSSLRHDLPFLRRRIKPAAPAPTVPVAKAPPTASTGPAFRAPLDLSRPTASAAAPSVPPAVAAVPLTLGRPRATAQPGPSASPVLPNIAPAVVSSTTTAVPGMAPRQTGAKQAPRTAETLLFPAPTTTDLHELTANSPLVRLNARQSAIGSLTVTGATTLVWESSDFITGARSADGLEVGRQVTTAGNRPLACFHEDQALIALRHVKNLRRALFVSADDSPLAIRLYGGSSVVVPPEAGYRSVLLVSRIGSVLELRSDPAPNGHDDESLWRAFGFRMSVELPPHG